MTKKFKIEHTISQNELAVYNAVISKLGYYTHFLSLKEIQEQLNNLTTSEVICLLNKLKERVIVIYDKKTDMEISTTLFKFDFIFVQRTEVYLNFENVEIFDVEFKHYLGKFRSNQACRSYENLEGKFNYYTDKIDEKEYNIVTDDWAVNIIKKQFHNE